MKRFRRIVIDDPPQHPPAQKPNPEASASESEEEDVEEFDEEDEWEDDGEWEDEEEDDEEFDDEWEDDDEDDEEDWEDEEEDLDDLDDEDEEDEPIVTQQSRFARTLRGDRHGEMDADLESKIRAGKYVPRTDDPWSAHFLYSTLIEKPQPPDPSSPSPADCGTPTADVTPRRIS
jgi:hypothetical protein